MGINTTALHELRSSYFYSIRCLCAGLRGGSKANRQTVLRDVEALRVKGVAN